MSASKEGPLLRAAYVPGPGVIEMAEFDISTVPGPGEVEIRMAGCGICGSNLHHFRNPESFPEDRRGAPGAMGHEMSGWVASVGPDVTTHQPGDLVALEPQLAAACGACHGCSSGAAWFCTDPSPLGIWGFADRILVKAAGAWILDPRIDPATATLMEALGVSVHALRVTTTCGIADDDLSGVRVAVLGAGATGLLAVAAARHLGATEVAVLARHPHQAALAARLGASLVVAEGDQAERELAEFGAGIVVECVGGDAETVGLALRVVAPAGEVSVLGLFDSPQQIDARSATRREVRMVFPIVYSTLRGRHDYEIAAAMLLEQPALGELVTDRFPLDEISSAYEQASSKGRGVVRVVVTAV